MTPTIAMFGLVGVTGGCIIWWAYSCIAKGVQDI